MSKQKDFESKMDDVYSEVMSKVTDDVLHDNIVELLNLNYQLGRASVYSENGWEYFEV